MALRDISAWSIRNPVIPLVFFTGLLIAGIVSFLRMDVTNQPDVEFPAVMVTIAQPGASPSEIENQITQRIESALRSITGVNSLQSTASEGASTTVVEFEIGTNLIEAVNEVETAVDTVRGSLPDGILEPQVSKIDVVGEPIAMLRSRPTTYARTTELVHRRYRRQAACLKIPGMAEVNRFGGVGPADRGDPRPGTDAVLRVSASQINSALRQSNLDAAGGLAEIGGTRQVAARARQFGYGLPAFPDPGAAWRRAHCAVGRHFEGA